MAIFCNYNIPIFPMTFGALTMGAGGCSVPMCGCSMPIFSPMLNYASVNPFMAMPIWSNYEKPIFKFENTNISSTDASSTTSMPLSSWYNPSTWFNNFSFNFSSMNLWQAPPISNFTFDLSRGSTSSNGYGDTFTRSSSATAANFNNNAVKNLSWWKEQGYNEEKGKQLAANTKKRSDALKAAGITAQCGRGVREGINDTFYDGNTHYEKFGQARLTGDQFLANDSHFRKVNVQGLHLSKEDIPAGAIVIYDAGYSNSSKSYCGHIEVSDGNGHGYSDLTTTLLQNHGRRREPKEIWIPV